MIYMGYFDDNRKIPSPIVRISIVVTHPPRYEGSIYKKLTPEAFISLRYKHTKDDDFFIQQFNEQLEKLTPKTINKELYNISDGSNLILINIKNKETILWMSLLKQWFEKHKIKCKEWGVKIDE